MISEQLESKLITQEILDERTLDTIQEETIRDWTINLNDIHSIGDASDSYMFKTEEPIVAITYFSLRATLYFVDDYIRVLNEWRNYEKFKIQQRIIRNNN